MMHAADGYPALKWDGLGLLPAVIQDHDGEVLLLGWMNEEAFEQTRATGAVWLWSRSRKLFWMRGDAHHPVLRVRDVRTNCMGDSLLIRVEADSGVCHSGNRACFFRAAENVV